MSEYFNFKINEEYKRNIDLGMALKLPELNHLEYPQLIEKINNFAQLNLDFLQYIVTALFFLLN